jgi:hypothetical protein
MPVLAKLIAGQRTLGEFARALRLKAGLARRTCIGPYGRFEQARHRSRAPWAALLSTGRWSRVYAQHLEDLAANRTGPVRVPPAKLHGRRA